MRYTFFTLILFTIITALFLLNSTKTIQWAADTYAPEYGFGYKQISGGLLTGLEVKALTFKNELLVDTLNLGWNPASLLYNKLSITHLEANGLNVENIKKVVEAFTTEEETDSEFVMPVSVGVGQLTLTVKPFEESGIEVRDITLDGEGIFYYGEGVNIDDLSLSIDTNVTNIELSGGIDEKHIRIKKLSIVDVDTIAFQDVIEKMIALNIVEEIVEEVEPEVAQYKAGEENFIPKHVRIDSAVLKVKYADYSQVKLKQGEVRVSSLDVDIYRIIDLKPNAVQVDSFTVLLDSNLSKLSMHSRLENETVTVESLSLRDIDTIAFMKFLGSLENNQTTTTETKVTQENKTIANNTASTLLPKYLYVKHMDSSVKSVTYDPLVVKSVEVNATDVKFNIGTLTAESGEVDVASVTN
ncbi:MAG: hypothetical protein GQ531_02755, partial [Sulfurovum sp.]|nr:hypothetical protein [Sulfurovum sp.]